MIGETATLTATLTAAQNAAMSVLSGPATHCLLFGGARSGKTFLLTRAVAFRAISVPQSRHAILRFRLNHVKASVMQDTWPKMHRLCFPDYPYTIHKGDYICEYPNGSQVWFGGLDDKERTEKVLGQEFATIYLNECSQISPAARDVATTRLAQVCNFSVYGAEGVLRNKMYYDCNPTTRAHWSYQTFVLKKKQDRSPIQNPDDYAYASINPVDNAANLPDQFLGRLKELPVRQRNRFLDGIFADDSTSTLWSRETIERNRHLGQLPEMQRIIVAVDPSGSRDIDNAANDEIGICVAGIGVDGIAYVLEDNGLKGSPATWGSAVALAYDRYRADAVVGEENYGGAMVEHTIQVARPNTPYRSVSATRAKHIRAEPIAALHERNKIRFAGEFPKLEDELCDMTTVGYVGEGSPNRADAFVWAITELFGEVVRPPIETRSPTMHPVDWRLC
jgi:phage terminase large subunit-like protein